MKDFMDKMAMHEDEGMGHESGELEAKMEVLRQLHEMASELLAGEMDGPMPGMEKVEVMAPDEEGLEEGLEKAQELMKKKDDLTDDLY